MKSTVKNIYNALIKDPRYVVTLILFLYLVLGVTVLGFNRSPSQIITTSIAAVMFEYWLAKIFKRDIGRFPVSALTTSFGLSILLNYSHNWFYPLIPVFIGIGSKYLFTFKGRHIYNPAMFAVVGSLVLTQELITSAPAYQWNGIASMAFFITIPALMLFMPKINRTALVGSWLITYTCLTALRAYVMKHHLPFETLFLGTLSSPAFLLFTFFMITDPATSPPDKKTQIRVGIALAVVDLLFHIRQSYYTFFFAAFWVATIRTLLNHNREAKNSGNWISYIKEKTFQSGYYRRPVVLSGIALAGFIVFKFFVNPEGVAGKVADFKLKTISSVHSGISPTRGDVYERVDSRIQHMVKWPLSVGDSVAAGDFDGDGLQDLYFSFPLKSENDRNSLYRNLGGFKFEKLKLEVLEERNRKIEQYGLPTNAMFVDYDSDGDKDLYITYAFGTPLLLQNQLKEAGSAHFKDITEKSGLADYAISISATFFDFNKDGLLDLYLANVLPENLPDYDKPTELNFFHLPKPQYEGDRRMFNFMHFSWHQARNGGMNYIYLQDKNHHFAKLDSRVIGMPETGWSLAVGTADFNFDGFTDIYVANDFGPDDMYLNINGKALKRLEGKIFGSIGKDTYKGMNTSIGDVDRNGYFDIYVSNVHHDMQAEGSMLWTLSAPKEGIIPVIEDKAEKLGALNERRFGWGAAMQDFNNDGWLDIAQANGMVDDTIDKKYDDCPDYWYVNEKLVRSPPSIHTYADMWGDIRGMCIYGKEKNRLYLNRGNGARPQFVDAADVVGMTELTNSRGMAAVDLDNDGRLDLVTTHMFSGPTIYQNVPLEKGSKQNFIRLVLESKNTNCPREAVGSQVRLISNPDAVQIREVQVVDGFNAQNERRIHFGLAEVGSAQDVLVTWCGNEKELYRALSVNQDHVLKQGTGVPYRQSAYLNRIR